MKQPLLIDEVPKDVIGCELASNLSSLQAQNKEFFGLYKPYAHILELLIGCVPGKEADCFLIGMATKLQFKLFANYRSFPFTYSRFKGWQMEMPSLEFVLKTIEDTLCPILDNENFINMLYCRINLRLRQLSFIDCSYANAIIYRYSSKKTERICNIQPPLGKASNLEYKEKVVNFTEQDKIFFYSSEKGLDEKKLCLFIEENAEKPIADLINLIEKDLGNFTLFFIHFNNLESYKPLETEPTKFNSVLSQLNTVRQMVREYCLKAPGNNSLLAAELELVIDEVFCNIVKHGYKGNQNGSILLQVNYEKDGISIELADQGISFDPSSVPHPNFCGDNDTGYGWFLIKNLVDQVVYLPKPAEKAWNRLKLHKKYITTKENTKISHTDSDGILIVTLDGEKLDASCHLDFKESISHLISSTDNTNFVFDLHNTTFIDSAGIGAFISFLRQIKIKGGKLKLAALTLPAQKIFELISMHKVFSCYSTLEEAVQSFKSDSK